MMKIRLFYSLLLFVFCVGCNSENTSEENSGAVVNEVEVAISEGLGETSEVFVSNWNRLVSTISEDEQTTTFFSINPDEVKWTSIEKQTLFYEFGNKENPQAIFVINLNINADSEVVEEIEFFAPATKDEVNSQQTKLFFLLVIALSDDTLDKNDRENILNNLGLYEEITNPKQLAGSVTKNNIRYILEPLIENNLLFGLNLYTSILDSTNA